MLGFSVLWFESSLGHMWESQVLLTDGEVVYILERAISKTQIKHTKKSSW